MIFNSVLETIGNTPLVRINRLNSNKEVKIFAKLEGQNPGGSVKDRIALQMVTEAELSGKLTQEKTILEATSGNTGIGLAMVAAIKGYSIELALPESVSIERRKILKAFGAKVILTPESHGTDGAILKVKELYEKFPEKYFVPDQYSNINNPLSHYYYTANEIISETKGRISFFVAGLGTSGTLMGMSHALKSFDKRIQIVAAEPFLSHKIQGLKSLEEAIIPEIYNASKIDEFVKVSDSDAFETSRLLAKKEGIFAGMSSGAAMFVALKKATEIKKGTIVVLLPDRGEKYLSTELFE
ncbi:MAG: cysteine synthase family protein [Candidatus Diapherotrites archaeon]